MRSLAKISEALNAQLKSTKIGKMILCERSGITARTLRHVLSGVDDYKMTTFLAVVDRLGLEMVLVPKGVAQVVMPPEQTVIMTRVRMALQGGHQGGGNAS